MTQRQQGRTPEEMQRRCPRLGHDVKFSYCLVCGDDGDLCKGIANCWWEYFDVVRYLEDNYPKETVANLLNPRPKGKIAGILELIERAKNRS